MASPDPAGFDAPYPEDAYQGAPELLVESAALMQMSTALRVDWQGAGGLAAEREYRLRLAALADRTALFAEALNPTGQAAAEQEAEAVRAAWDLFTWDRDHPDGVAGPHDPGSMEWDPSQRPYVRQEYHAWKGNRNA
ncbi:hypothetical protein ACFXCZ_35475 [Streptomyces sp. NPDC059396]|uniref:hypothetical protein n=1 Tax=Streptomyces sp. NPDC059396 TaxID=3346819 RepID=UPI0036AF911B